MGVGNKTGAQRVTVVWCEDLWMEALYVAQSWRPKAAAQWKVQAAGESDEGDWRALGCSNWNQDLSHAENVYSAPHLQAVASSVKLDHILF